MSCSTVAVLRPYGPQGPVRLAWQGYRTTPLVLEVGMSLRSAITQLRCCTSIDILYDDNDHSGHDKDCSTNETVDGAKNRSDAAMGTGAVYSPPRESHGSASKSVAVDVPYEGMRLIFDGLTQRLELIDIYDLSSEYTVDSPNSSSEALDMFSSQESLS